MCAIITSEKRKQHEAQGKRLREPVASLSSPRESQVQFFFQKLRPQNTTEITSPVKTLQGFTNDGQCRRMFLIWQKRSESNGCF